LGESSESAYGYRIVELAKGLRDNNIPCDLVFADDHATLKKQTVASVGMLSWVGALRKYDFIYCGAPMAGQALYFARRLLSAPIILDMHGDDLAQSAQFNEVISRGRKKGPSLRVRITYGMAMSAADYWITQSRYQRADLIAAGVDSQRAHVVRNGVDLELFRFVPQPKEPLYTFAYVGAFQVWQGIDNLIEAFQRISDPSIRMMMVGFQPQDAALKKSLHEKFGSRIKLVDMVDRTQLLELLASASIMLSPRPAHIASRAAFPTKFAEYAAMGRPILVTNVDETAEFVTKCQCGFVSEAHPEALARTMEQAASTPWEHLAAMGVSARKMAEEHFSWAAIGKEYANLVLEIVNNPRARKRT
jgi:glycosyltransferase involved in cell wall biosynthesis